MCEHEGHPIEAKPVESGEPSDLMAALVAGVRDAAAAASDAEQTGRRLSGQIGALETNVDRAVRRRTALIAAAAVVVVLVLSIGAAFVVLQVQGGAQAQESRDCTTPADPESDCQRRLVPTQARLLDESERRTLAASVAVAECLQAKATDIRACAEAKIRPVGP